nr:hypothetical protein RAR13_11770 [Aminobacter aminovorans]
MSMGFPSDGTLGDYAFSSASDAQRRIDVLERRVARLENDLHMALSHIEQILKRQAGKE